MVLAMDDLRKHSAPLDEALRCDPSVLLDYGALANVDKNLISLYWGHIYGHVDPVYTESPDNKTVSSINVISCSFWWT